MEFGAARVPRPGDVIAGKYVIERLLGQGGMGAVFAARHIKLAKSVAIKVMLSDGASPEAAQRFVNEGRAAANIQSEHVVRVDDVDEEMGYAYMVLELLDGEDLADHLERAPKGRLAPSVAADYVSQALKGVAHAHALGIVHRDLKPSNLFLARRSDGSTVVKVLDFGISKAQGSSPLAASPAVLTSTKAMLGSPLYMSPEQLRSSKNVDQRADIWAVGVILYELMSGQRPFHGETLGELFAAILETDPVPLRQLVPDVPPALDQIVHRCLRRRPEERFASAGELVTALAPFAGRAVDLRAATVVMPLPAPSSSGALLPGRPSSDPFVSATPASDPLLSSPASRMSRSVVVAPGQAQAAAVQTGDGWQNTAPGPVATASGKKGSVAGLVAGLGLVFLLVASAGAVVAVRSRSNAHSTGASVSAEPPVASVSASVAPPVTTVVAAAASSASPTPAASAPPPPPSFVPASKPSPSPKHTVARPAAPAPEPAPKPNGNLQETR